MEARSNPKALIYDKILGKNINSVDWAQPRSTSVVILNYVDLFYTHSAVFCL